LTTYLHQALRLGMSGALPLFSSLYGFRFWKRQYFLAWGFVCISVNGKNSTVESFGENKKILLLALCKGSTPVIGLLRYSTRQNFQSD